MDSVLPAISHLPKLLGSILAVEPGTVYVFDLVNDRFLYLSDGWLKRIGHTPESLTSLTDPLAHLIHPDDLPTIRQSREIWRHSSMDQIRYIEYRLRYPDGQWGWMVSHEIPFAQENAEVTQILGIAHNCSRQIQAETLLHMQIAIMEQVLEQRPLESILNGLVEAIETHTPGMVASILLTDEQGKIQHIAAPNLPLDMVHALNGLTVGPNTGSCGTAIYSNESVFVADIASDPRWERYRDLVLPWGFRACWSSPIRNAKQSVIGSFALYFRTIGLPTKPHRDVIHTATHLAAIAIENRRLLDQSRLNEQRYHQLFECAPEGMALVSANTLEFLDVNEFLCRLLGYERSELIGFTMPQILHSHHEWDCMRNCFQEFHRKPGECRLRQRNGTFFTAEISVSASHNEQRVVIIRDVSERKQVELRIRRLTQLYSALSECNQAIIRTRSMEELFPLLCRDAVEQGGMDMAWIGEIDPDTQCIKPLAVYGKQSDYVNGLNISVDPLSPFGNGPVGQAYRNQTPIWCQDFLNTPGIEYWRTRASAYRWGSCAILPLWRSGSIQGFFLLYSHTPGILDEGVRGLLLEMASDISFAWDNFDIQADRQRTHLALAEREAHLRTILETQPECVKLVSPTGEILEINRAGLEMLELDDLNDLNHRPISHFVAPLDKARLIELHSFVMQGEMRRLEFSMITAKGALRHVETYAAPLRHANGEVRAMLAITRDLTERRSSQERIQYLANFDTLTGLPNRTYLEEHLRYALQTARRSEDHLALLFIDLDNFKNINDSLGHVEGDQVLRHVTHQMRQMLRSEDVLARLGGDEFVLLLPGCDASGTAQVASKLLNAMGAPYRASHYELRMSASIGISLYPDNGDSLEELTRAADLAMYRAKQAGRNQFCFFTQDMHASMLNNLQMVSALRTGLENQAFYLVYQPKIRILDGVCTGLEALLRWTDPQMGDIPPDRFIPIAEESGLILPLGEWVIRSVLSQLQQWQINGRSMIPISVNVSAVQFRQSQFSERIGQWLQKYGIDAQWLELELTESVAMTDAEREGAQMLRIRNQGHILTIDDFGTGYSSLSYLKRFQVHKLKIDQSFIRDIAVDPDDRAIVAAIIDMSHHLGFTVIAEGVETELQRDFLATHHCDEAQGFLYSRPLPLAQLDEFLVTPHEHHVSR